jgi:hypothetical protein
MHMQLLYVAEIRNIVPATVTHTKEEVGLFLKGLCGLNREEAAA